jgi:CelD/BcsL family acetyltransferase involved in cellulose biosynthesis
LLAVDVVTGLDKFKALRNEWNHIARSPGHSIFQTWEWSWHWWNANRRGKKLWLLTARDDGALIGIAPLYLSSSYLGIPIKTLALIGTNGADYLDFIIENRRPDVIAALNEFLLDAAGWDAIDLHQMPSDDLASTMESRVRAAGYSCQRMEHDPTYSLELPESWDDYLACLSKKFRSNVQYYGRRLARDYEVTFRLSEPEAVVDDMSTFLKLHRKRFVSKKKPGAYMSPKFRKFHTEVATALCESNCLRLYVMELNGIAIATLYGFSFNDTFYYYLGGFEPELGAMSVSTVLIAKAMEDAIAAGCKRFDFLRGHEPYKKKWLAGETHNTRLIVGRPGARAGLVQKMLSLENDIARKAKDKLAQN